MQSRNYTGTAKTSYTSAEWESLENAGCVFLPAAGFRNGSGLYGVGSSGYYWSSSAAYDQLAYLAHFESGGVKPDEEENRGNGFSVR